MSSPKNIVFVGEEAAVFDGPDLPAGLHDQTRSGRMGDALNQLLFRSEDRRRVEEAKAGRPVTVDHRFSVRDNDIVLLSTHSLADPDDCVFVGDGPPVSFAELAAR